MEGANRMTVKQAAMLMGASEQFVRIAMQRGELDIGTVVKISGHYTYIITKQKFKETTGISVDDKEEENEKIQDASAEQ